MTYRSPAVAPRSSPVADPPVVRLVVQLGFEVFDLPFEFVDAVLPVPFRAEIEEAAAEEQDQRHAEQQEGHEEDDEYLGTAGDPI